MLIKIAKSPGVAMELALADGSTLSQAVAVANAEKPSSKFEIGPKTSYTRNGITIDATTLLREGDIVIQAENLKGAMPKITFGRAPGGSVDVTVPEGTTYRQALDLAVEEAKNQGRNFNGSLDKTSVRVAGDVIVDPDNTSVPDTDTVVGLYENLKGAAAIVIRQAAEPGSTMIDIIPISAVAACFCDLAIGTVSITNNNATITEIASADTTEFSVVEGLETKWKMKSTDPALPEQLASMF